ncbi:Olfactory receptor 2T7 [Sciurus carolinensis]|uniref:Olfactory receptor 2T7 n=1 Tax=Sciurus carolinensis TaxID=30640 RepID=A0AA41SY47_SCICA|nr:Olfactory receptor 2T7 [Sciurus carolinensis]
MVVFSLFYGATNYMDVLSHSYHNREQDKAVSNFYTILMPMLNPLIYSLRNKDVTGALQRALGKCLSSGKGLLEGYQGAVLLDSQDCGQITDKEPEEIIISNEELAEKMPTCMGRWRRSPRNPQ